MEIITGMRIIANESRLSIDATVKLSVTMSENNNRNKNIILSKITVRISITIKEQ